MYCGGCCRAGGCSYGCADGEPLGGLAQAGPEAAAVGGFCGGVAFGGECGDFGAFVGEIALGGRELGLADVAILQVVIDWLEVGLRDACFRGRCGFVRGWSGNVEQNRGGKRGQNAGICAAAWAGVCTLFLARATLASVVVSTVSRCCSRAVASPKSCFCAAIVAVS